GTNSLGTTSLSGNMASYTNAALAPGSHSITAVYNGDTNFNASTSGATNQNVLQASTTAALISSTNPTLSGQTVVFTARVSAVAPGSGTPSGTVQFSIDGTNFGGAVTLSSGNATSAPISSLTLSNHTVTAAYSGDSSYIASDNTGSPLTQTVNKAGSTTTVSSSLNP